jgi:hypothetical protein
VIVDGYSHCGILKYQPVEVVLHTMAQASIRRCFASIWESMTTAISHRS